LITNRHVVRGRHQDTDQPLNTKTLGIPDRLTVWHNHAGHLGQWIAVTEPLYDVDAPRWKEHPKHGARADLAALPLTDLQGVELYAYDPANPGAAIAVGPGDAVSVVGFPFGFAGGGRFAIWATGFMATEPIADFNDLPVSLIDCRARQGQSGSPVIAYRNTGSWPTEGGGTTVSAGPAWRLLGVYSGRINVESDLGVMWKLSALSELIASA